MLNIGTSEHVLEIPQFAELYGYGPFAGRRHLGVHDPLYCRAVSFNDGTRHALVIYTDTCTSDDQYCREMRAVLAAKLNLDPSGIAFVATHTHSAPKIGRPEAGIAWGEPHPEFQNLWRRTVLQVATEAYLNEEPIASVAAGNAPLANPLGSNRVNQDQNITDPAIRWMRFRRADGSVKLLLHNHGIHGISMNSTMSKYVSADWMGAANRLIRELHLADMPLFLLGPCGDINTCTTNKIRKKDDTADFIAEQYVNDLQQSLVRGDETPVGDTFQIGYALKTVEFPVVRLTAAELAAEAVEWKKFAETHENPLAVSFYMNYVDRLNEMIILLQQGRDLRSFHDLQVMKIGPAAIFFVPGELFIEPGLALMQNSSAAYRFVATVANGSGAYLPSESTMKKYPNVGILNHKSQIWGFYEIYDYMHSHHFKYQDHIAEFVISSLIELENSF